MESDSSFAFIWDLDGTLLDSYKVIVPSLRELSVRHGLNVLEDEISRCVIEYSVSYFLDILSSRCGTDTGTLAEEYREISNARRDQIPLMPGARDTLQTLRNAGAANYLYTHRGASTRYLLNRHELTDFFADIITSENGFARKPSGEALRYLLQTHSLDSSRTFYVGDRTIDMDCAADAGVKGILYKPCNSRCIENGAQSYIVKCLPEIPHILYE